MIPGVTVSTTDIRTLATTVENLRTKYIDASTTLIQSFAIHPGAFTDGDALNNQVMDRVTELRTALTNLHDAMVEINTGLKAIATEYDKTNDTTTEISNDLEKMITDVTSHLPGFEV